MAEPEALQIKRIMDELDRFTENAVIEISQVVFDELREGTPVETGHLKSNWIPSIGSFSAVPTGSPDNPTDSAQSAGETRLLSYRLEQGRVYCLHHQCGRIRYVDHFTCEDRHRD